MKTLIAAVAALMICVPAVAQRQPSAIVFDFTNESKDRHTMPARAAGDKLAIELQKTGVYNVIAREEVLRVAKKRNLEPPFSEQDLMVLAKELGVQYAVTGEIRQVEVRARGGRMEVEVGIIVRVRDVALGEMINGAAERGIAADGDGKRPEAILMLDAAESAAFRAASRIAAYRPVEGTILNTAGRGVVILNKGIDNGIKRNQEFLAFRNGVVVGRLKAMNVYASHTEMVPTDLGLGIQPQDHALAVFPEPKFGPRDRP